jgi:hypothetical protein
MDLDQTLVSTNASNGPHDEKTSFANVDAVLRKMESSKSIARKNSAAEIRGRIFVFNVCIKDSFVPMWTLLRPGAREFISFAMTYFKKVSIWSAGKSAYVDEVTNVLFPPTIEKPSLVLHWDDCARFTASSTTTSGKKFVAASAVSTADESRIMFHKPLAQIVEDANKEEDVEEFQPRKKRRKGGGESRPPPPPSPAWSLKNTIILDDRDDIAKDNIDNLLHIPPFEPEIAEESLLATADTALEELTLWLIRPHVIEAFSTDVRKISKEGIFSAKSR